jgi:glycine cleavage system transcriptional repressor
MLVSVPEDRLTGLDADLDPLVKEGYKVTTTLAERAYAQIHPGWSSCRIEVEGADHEGIIHEVSRYLSERGINIEAMDSETTQAPVSGSPLFSMTAELAVPPGLSGSSWEAGLDAIADRMNLEIRVIPELRG